MTIGGSESEGFPPETTPLVLPADGFAAVRKLQARLNELENAVNWGTHCLNCAAMLDVSIADHERAERAAEKLTAVRELGEELGEPLRRMLLEILDAQPTAPKPAPEPDPPMDPLFPLPTEGSTS